MKRIIGIIIVLGFMFGALIGCIYGHHGQGELEKTIFVQGTVAKPTISATTAVLMGLEDGSILYEKDKDKRMYPASTTKIMTALIALETMEKLNLGLDCSVIVPKEAVGVEGSSLYLCEGERLTMEELLHGMLLQSGNDSAEAVAICIGGTRENFIKMMNEKAKELGCDRTRFTNPSGLFDDNHFTTARDLAVIGAEAMKRDDFRSIVESQIWESETSERCFRNKNKTVFDYEGGNGVKIGFTKASGRTLVASATREGQTLIAVVLNDGNWFKDAYRLLDYGFEVSNEERGGK